MISEAAIIAQTNAMIAQTNAINLLAESIYMLSEAITPTGDPEPQQEAEPEADPYRPLGMATGAIDHA